MLNLNLLGAARAIVMWASRIRRFLVNRSSSNPPLGRCNAPVSDQPVVRKGDPVLVRRRAEDSVL